MLIQNLALDFAGDICFDLYGDINTQKIFSLLEKCKIHISPHLKYSEWKIYVDPAIISRVINILGALQLFL